MSFPTQKIRKIEETSSYRIYEQTTSVNSQSPELPVDLIVTLFNKLGFASGCKVSLINKQYKNVFNTKYIGYNFSPFVCIELFKDTLLKMESENNSVNYFRTLQHLMKFDSKRFLVCSVKKIAELFNSIPNDLPICLNIFFEIIKKCSGKGLKTHLLLEGLEQNNCIETSLAIAYARNGELKRANVLASKLTRAAGVVDEICLQRLIQNPNEITTIIDQTNLGTLKRFSYGHMRKLLRVLSPIQMSLVLQLIREKIGLSVGLVHGYILSEKWDLALQGLENGWKDETFTFSDSWKNNPYLYFIKKCQLKKNNQELLKITSLLERKRAEVNEQTSSGIFLTLIRAYLKMDKQEEAEKIKEFLNAQDKLKANQIVLQRIIKKLARELLKLDKSKIGNLRPQLIDTVKLDFEKIESVKFWMKIDPDYFLKCCREKNLSSLEISELLKKIA